MNFKIKKIRSDKHRKFVASQPCVVTGYQGDKGVPHHLLRCGDSRGVAMKVCDMWCVPLHHDIHMALHKNGNEVVFFANHGLTYETVMSAAIHYASISPDKRIREAMRLWEINNK